MNKVESKIARPVDWPAREQRHVIVGGYGPVGRVVADELTAAGMDVTVIELNLNTVERQLGLGRMIVYGDVADPEVLKRARIESAHAFIVTIPDETAAIAACRAARSLAPDTFIAVRTNHMSTGMQATAAGADHVTVEELITAQAMRDAVISKLAR